MRAMRVVLIVLLVVGAYLAAAPWLGCIHLVYFIPGHGLFSTLSPQLIGLCTFGINTFPFPVTPGQGIPGFSGPYWGNLFLGILYLVAAVFVTRRRRPL